MAQLLTPPQGPCAVCRALQQTLCWVCSLGCPQVTTGWTRPRQRQLWGREKNKRTQSTETKRQRHRGRPETDTKERERGLCDKVQVWPTQGQRVQVKPRMSSKSMWDGQTAGWTQVLTWGTILRGLRAGVLVGHTLQRRQGHVQAAVRTGPEGAETVTVQVCVALKQKGYIRAWPLYPAPSCQPGTIFGTPGGWQAPF